MNRKGYNLIEVLIAMALLSWVILVISGLFIYGQKGVYSGKTQTKAVAIGQKLYEDIKNLPSYDQKFEIFGGARDGAAVTLSMEDDYTNPFADPDDILHQTIEGWRQVLVELGPTARIEATVTPTVPIVGTGQTFGNSFYLQYHIQVFWSEGLRDRHVTFDFSI